MNHLSKYLCAGMLCVALPVTAFADGDETDVLKEEIERMQQQLMEMQERMAELEREKAEAEAEAREEPDQEEMKQIAAETYDEKSSEGINFGGAVRFQYAYEDYNDINEDTTGVLEMDTFRINVDGSVGDVILSGEYRFYQYMHVIHHAWAGYNFTDSLQGQVGVHQVPFGVTPYNSHNFFFSSNYYLGLEDDYDAGFKLIYDNGPWNFQGAFYLNDELGGADGYYGFDPGDLPHNLNDRYSYDIIGARPPGEGEGTFAAPTVGAFDDNVWNGRVAYTLDHGSDSNTEFGFSGQYGDVAGGDGSSVGDQYAVAAHLVGNYGPWNIQLQATEYEYDMDNNATRMVVGAYDFFDTIPAEARTYTGNVAYSLPVSWGPVSNLTFYNDYSLITDKSADQRDTWMNVTGVAVTAGGLYTYIDFITAKNQPFVGGSIDSPVSTGTNFRFNVNFGYYF